MRRGIIVAVIALLVAACDGYPDGWAGIARSNLLGTGCPDLTGTWQLHPSRAGRPYSQSIIDQKVRNRERQRWHWQTVTIAGRALDSLTLTLRRHPETIAAYHDTMNLWGDPTERQYRLLQEPATRWRGSFARMTDSEYAENLAKLTLPAEQQVTLHHGDDYSCASGWLVGDRTVHDPGPDPSRPRPDTVIGVVRMAVSKEGHLVFNAKYDEDVEISLWCGDGCRGVPVGRWEQDEWARLDAVAAPPPLVLERPWAAPAPPPPIEPLSRTHAPLQTAADVQGALAPFVPAGARLLRVVRDGSRYRAEIALDAGLDAIRPMFEPLARSQRFPTAEVIGATRDSASMWTIALRLGVVSTETATSPESMEARIRAVLPAGASLDRVRRSGPVFFADLRFTSRASYLATLSAFRASPEFEAPEVMQAENVGTGVRAAFRLRERITP